MKSTNFDIQSWLKLSLLDPFVADSSVEPSTPTFPRARIEGESNGFQPAISRGRRKPAVEAVFRSMNARFIKQYVARGCVKRRAT